MLVAYIWKGFHLSARNKHTVWLAITAALAGTHATTIGEVLDSLKPTPNPAFVTQAGLVTLGIGIFVTGLVGFRRELHSQDESSDVYGAIAVALVAGLLSIGKAVVGEHELPKAEVVGALWILVSMVIAFVSLPFVMKRHPSSKFLTEYALRLCAAVIMAALLGAIVQIVYRVFGGQPGNLGSDPFNAAVFALWAMILLSSHWASRPRPLPAVGSLVLASVVMSGSYQYITLAYGDKLAYATREVIVSIGLFCLLQLFPVLSSFLMIYLQNPGISQWRTWTPEKLKLVAALVIQSVSCAVIAWICHRFAPVGWVKADLWPFVCAQGLTGMVTAVAVTRAWTMPLRSRITRR